MLYHWLYPLADTIPGLNVVRYITFRTAAATLTALFISFIVGPWLIKRLAALRVGQPIREIGPEHCIVSSDKGQGRGEEGHDGPAVSHTEGLAVAAQILRSNGFTEAELDLMFKSNPARLLGLPVLWACARFNAEQLEPRSPARSGSSLRPQVSRRAARIRRHRRRSRKSGGARRARCKAPTGSSSAGRRCPTA